MDQPTPRPVDTAPRDGTTVRLLVDYREEANADDVSKTEGEGYVWSPGPLEDADVAWTIGHNNLDNDGEDVWQFAGWNWSQDHYTQGRGKVIGWLPLHPEADIYSATEALQEWLLRIQRAAKLVVLSTGPSGAGDNLLGALHMAVNGQSPPGWEGQPIEPSYTRLRDEVAYWRAEAGAMLWAGMAHANDARRKAEADRAITYDIAVIQPTRAALAAALNGRIHHPYCEGCDAPVKAGDAVYSYEGGEVAHVDCGDPQKADPLSPEAHRYQADPEDDPAWPAKMLAQADAYLNGER